jgi:glucokinase
MADETRRYVGVDLGGTKILTLAVSGPGEVLGRFKLSTRTDGTPLGDQIVETVEGLLSECGLQVGDFRGVGVGVPGVVDSQTSVFITAPNLPIDDHHLAEGLRERLGLPVVLGNDVNLGTLAEVWRGAGQGATTVVGMFVGTGIGGGVVIDGRMRSGAEDLAGEIGHLVLMVDGPECGCGNKGCFEALASRTAIEREIRAALEAGRSSSIAEKGGRIRSGALAAALQSGDEVVTEVMTRVGHTLAQGVLTIRHLLDPDLVILGGGVMEACGDFLLPLIEEEVRADPLTGSRDVLKLVRSELGDDAVALGAAALIRAELGDDAPQAVTSALPAEPAKPLPEYPIIGGVDFGSVTVDDEKLEHDIHIRADGKLRKRRKSRLRKAYGTSHVVDAEELKQVCKGNPGLLIVGSGFQNMVRLTDDAKEFLRSAKADWRLVATPEAVELYNGATGRKALLLHVTC